MASPEYVFSRDYLDNNRINLQHYQWTHLFGYHLHPSIPVQELSNGRIADVGTGTGLWLTDLASRLPGSVCLDGLDVSYDAMPPLHALPANVTMRKWDIRQPLPEDLVGAYDVVHIRNFAFVLRDRDISQILHKLVKMIKPGGYLQWGEPDMASLRIEKLNPNVKTEATSQLLMHVQAAQQQDGRIDPKWVPTLSNLFREAGLTQVVADVREAPPHLAVPMYECSLLTVELALRQAGVESHIRDLMPKIGSETREGAWWAFTRWTVVGKTPRVS